MISVGKMVNATVQFSDIRLGKMSSSGENERGHGTSAL